MIGLREMRQLTQDAMPETAQEEREQRALIEGILASPVFAKSARCRQLLQILFEHRHEALSSNAIALLLYKRQKAGDTEESAVRGQCSELREALRQYSPALLDAWQCTLPRPEAKGYRLEFSPIKRTPAQLFWWPHVEHAERMAIVTNALLFFYDYDEQSVIRFFDTNDQPSSEQCLSALEHNHQEAFAPGLKPVHFYLASGEVTACEILQRWFLKTANLLPPRRVSRDMPRSDILHSSPVLLGNRHTNKIIRQMRDSREAGHLAYRFGEKLGTVHIHEPRDTELHALSRFGITPEGNIGPTRNWEVIFGMATRFPHPGGSGPVTIISSDFTSLGMARIVEALTSDEKAGKLLNQMEWPPDKPLPESFELLFTLRPAPGNIEGELSNPELVWWRP